jgi:hypothetical protein
MKHANTQQGYWLLETQRSKFKVVARDGIFLEQIQSRANASDDDRPELPPCWTLVEVRGKDGTILTHHWKGIDAHRPGGDPFPWEPGVYMFMDSASRPSETNPECRTSWYRANKRVKLNKVSWIPLETRTEES